MIRFKFLPFRFGPDPMFSGHRLNPSLTVILLLMLFTTGLRAQRDQRWGWTVHRYINEQALDVLPPAMAFFQTYRTQLSEHAVDPDQGNLPGYYHYIDIDAYPEFFQGTLPHEWTDFINLYGYDTAISNGTVPWVIEEWTDSLASLMRTGDWEEAVQVAAELGHYVADAHNPLHLTLNYNGQNTGNYGIHSRYESQMVPPHLEEILLTEDQARFWENPIDSIFLWIDDLYPFVANIMTADDSAAALDPSYSTTYYNTMWALLDSLTMTAIQRAEHDLASLWYTAWVKADYRVPSNSLNILTGTIVIPTDYSTIQAGIDAAVEGEDMVLVLPGLYLENIQFQGKEIVVQSSQGPLVTFIEAADTGHVVQFSQAEGSGARLEGFTIRGGGSFIGGGIICDGASPVIRHNIITGNEAGRCAGLGGGIAAVNSAHPIIINNSIMDNAAQGDCDCICYFGGGLYVDSLSFPIIGGSPFHGNNIFGNSADIGQQVYRAGPGTAVTASYNYWGGSCPPDTTGDVWPGNQFNISYCQESEWNIFLGSDKTSILETYPLLRNYPNPFNHTTVIEYEVPEKNGIRLAIYDLSGREITVLVDGVTEPGLFRIVWNGKDRLGRSISSGLYLCRFTTKNQVIDRKLLILK
ncbi:MAG: T9SS type A sorting domain-containing protein [Fidelibacterota bacterium]